MEMDGRPVEFGASVANLNSHRGQLNSGHGLSLILRFSLGRGVVQPGHGRPLLAATAGADVICTFGEPNSLLAAVLSWSLEFEVFVVTFF
jgi:hypothetical protein